MIQTVEIRSLEEVTKIILDQEYNAEIGRLRSTYLFRGMPSAGFRLETSLMRNCGDLMQQLEPSILKNFSKYAIKDDPQINESVWRQMMMGQQYGLPTRLLDWTHSSMIALHFATAENDFAKTDKRDGVVWRIDAKELAGLLPGRYRQELGKGNTFIFDVAALNRVTSSASEYDADMLDRSMVIVEPPSADERIVNQYAYFSVVPTGMKDIEAFLEENTHKTVRYIIRKEIRWDIRDLLDQANVSERIVYPGLEGLSRWIARHYYHTNDSRDNRQTE